MLIKAFGLGNARVYPSEVKEKDKNRIFTG
jgi:hypothetical protein